LTACAQASLVIKFLVHSALLHVCCMIAATSKLHINLPRHSSLLILSHAKLVRKFIIPVAEEAIEIAGIESTHNPPKFNSI
jgi:hypothetical protein